MPETPESTADARAQFAASVSASLDALYGVALRLAKNRADAEDLVAEAVCKAWCHRDDLLDPACFRPWLFRILANTFFSDARRRKARPECALAADEADAGDDFSLFERLHRPFLLWYSEPEQEFLNKLLREDIERAVDALPETFRVVVVLADLEEFSYAEIAQILKLPVGTVRSRLARGRTALQRTLWTQAQAAGVVAVPSRKPGADV